MTPLFLRAQLSQAVRVGNRALAKRLTQRYFDRQSQGITMSTTRIYHAINSLTQEVTLVRASSATQAIRHVAEKGWTAEVAKAEDLVDLVGSGTKVQDATAQE